MTIKRLFIAFFMCVLAIAASAITLPSCPQVVRHVNDFAGIIKQPQVLEDSLQAFAKTSGSQIVVVTLPEVQDMPMDSVGMLLFNQWKLDAHTLLIVSSPKSERGIPYTHIYPGAALQDKFPRAITKHVASDQITGPYKDGKGFDYGMMESLRYIEPMILGTYTASDYKNEQEGNGWKYFVLAGVLLLIFVGASKFFPRKK